MTSLIDTPSVNVFEKMALLVMSGDIKFISMGNVTISCREVLFRLADNNCKIIHVEQNLNTKLYVNQ